MSIKQESETSWEMVTVCGEHNEYESITATKDGLEIGCCGTIPWDKLDEARASVAESPQDADENIPAEMLAQCAVNMNLRREIEEAGVKFDD